MGLMLLSFLSDPSSVVVLKSCLSTAVTPSEAKHRCTEACSVGQLHCFGHLLSVRCR
ncbi:hypothetical protein GDO86_018783 [Hymenochirus boettgeri]|uniref:Secreted protein n=1 Tax=Hymenochirus boettgeri TaxID=247094 RepID=A0A8T2IMR3_9PIPI|nr:hypothetical protein GDO86_018783 [Hymenochirus boettgeri]